MKYSCSGCGEVFLNKEKATECCYEKIYEVSECCEADIVVGAKTEYPLGGSTWGIDYQINICEKCNKEVD